MLSVDELITRNRSWRGLVTEWLDLVSLVLDLELWPPWSLPKLDLRLPFPFLSLAKVSSVWGPLMSRRTDSMDPLSVASMSGVICDTRVLKLGTLPFSSSVLMT